MKITKAIKKELVLDFFLYIVSIISITILYRNNILLTFVLILTWVLGIKYWYKKYDRQYLVAGAIMGPLAEIICIYFGAWKYANPTYLAIPIWLPLAWGLATMLIKRSADTAVVILQK